MAAALQARRPAGSPQRGRGDRALRAFVDVGSNLEREASIHAALRALEREFGALRVSHVYESAPVGFADQPDFYNLAVEFATDLDGDSLRARLRRLEDELGRVRGPNKDGPRTIDLDLTLLEGEGRAHPQVLTHAFVLVPLAELAPELVHPETGRTLAEEAAELPRPEGFRRVTGFFPPPLPGTGR